MEYMEFSAKTVNDAITNACQHFTVASDKLDYEVVEEGSSGFLGINAKKAVIKARVKEEKVSIYRVLPVLGIVISLIVTSGVLCYINKLEIDQIICIIFLVLAFIPIFLFELTFQRNRDMIAKNNQTNYKRVLAGVILISFIAVGLSYMPEYFRLIMLIPLIMSAFSNDLLGLIVGLFYTVVLALTNGTGIYELLAYVIMVVIAGMLSKALKYVEYRLLVGVTFLFSSVLFPNIFYYFANDEISFQNLVQGIINGFIIAVYVIAFYPNIREKTYREKHYYYGDILADDFVQVREIRNLSNFEYQHARKVSDIAYKYALRLDLNADLAAAAGFYYRLGKWLGDPPIENGVKKAMELCFPEELIQILREYNAKDELPSTQESALVHMIDGLVVKMELHDDQVGTSQWNREVLINQTLNEYSSAGLYDKAGVSINMFIKVRAWLTKEELI